MPVLNPKPSENRIRQANMICATVLSLETSSGRTVMGLPRNQESITPPMIRMSRDTTRMTIQRGIASAMPSDM